MKLHEAPYYDIRVGDKMISVIGTPGIITKFDPKRITYNPPPKSSDCYDQGWVEIEWENGNKSSGYIFDKDYGTDYLGYLEYIGRY